MTFLSDDTKVNAVGSWTLQVEFLFNLFLKSMTVDIDKRFIGLDAGSVSVKAVLLDGKGNILERYYVRHHGQPLIEASGLLDKIGYADSIGITGSAGKLIASILGVESINEITANSYPLKIFHKEARTVIEMGGEDSKLILLNNGRVKDFSMNSLCAAGTGAFLDQQAERLGLRIEAEFGELALKSKTPPRIAGRCSVFAKSDMIHLQQIATPDYDIVAGLCYAVARNFKSTICRGKKVIPPAVFLGGVAANKGMVRAFSDVLGFNDEEFIVPENHAIMGAIGAALIQIEKGTLNYTGHEKFKDYLKNLPAYEGESLSPLNPDQEFFARHSVKEYIHPIEGEQVDAYLGIDIGSISTNLVVLDEKKRVLSKRYLMTAGRPIEAVRRGLEEIGEEIGGRLNIFGVGTTGSGRYMIGDFVGADIVKNEITAQATAAVEIDPSVDTIFEIGGQDSKYISLKDAVIVDFEMNKVCAAGTGSFLEEQAERLNISIKEEFSSLCMKAESPCRLGERCTVFMETTIVGNQQKGASKDNLIAGLGYSIAINYLNKVVVDKPVGSHIFFQGGVAFNKGVVAAFEKILGKKITIPPHHDVTGAIGMALIAMRHMNGKTVNSRESGIRSQFKGFGLSKRNYALSTFECKACSNVCEIKRVKIEGEDIPLYYGGRCEKYDVKRTSKTNVPEIPDLFAEREKLLLSQYESYKNHNPNPIAKIGIPLIFFFYEYLPFWATLLSELGFEVVLSDKTNRQLIHKGVEAVLSETCFPVKVAHGHVINLTEKGVDAVLIPSFINLSSESDSFESGFACPYVQTMPYVVRAALGKGIKILRPLINLRRGPRYLEDELRKTLHPYGISIKSIRKAIDLAEEAQRNFYDEIERRGKEVIDNLRERTIVIVSRPYNGFDEGVNLNLPSKLREIGVLTIPMDFLPLRTVDISKNWPNMYWRSGQRILQSAEIIRRNKYLNALYITNFGCGPDSFIIRYFKERLAGKPFLQIEIDEHSADAGAITRCEAFLDSLENVGGVAFEEAKVVKRRPVLGTSKEKRVIYLPKMSDHAYALAAAFQACGVDSEVLPESDTDAITLGREFTSGKECYPCTVTTGDMLKKVKSHEFNPDKSAFFMPSGTGPCRFGQYNVFHRIVLDELGHGDVPVYAPNQDSKFYKELGMVGNDFIRLAWQGILAVEFLIKALHEKRPYEANKGDADELYKKYLGKISNAIKGRKNGLPYILKDVRKDFESLPIHKGLKKPLIGIIGEIFVRFNEFSNENIIRKVEALGAEVWLAPFEEWMYYLNYMALDKAVMKKSYSDIINVLLTRFLQKRIEKKQAKPFKGFLKTLHEPKTGEIIKNASPYLDRSFEGEAILSMGKAVDLAKHGVSGIINTIPFTCMPGNIVTALMKSFSEDYPDIPCLHMVYDGNEQAGSETKLEAFMSQAISVWQEKNKDA